MKALLAACTFGVFCVIVLQLVLLCRDSDRGSRPNSEAAPPAQVAPEATLAALQDDLRHAHAQLALEQARLQDLLAVVSRACLSNDGATNVSPVQAPPEGQPEAPENDSLSPDQHDWTLRLGCDLEPEEYLELRCYSPGAFFVRQPNGMIGMVTLEGEGDSSDAAVRNLASKAFQLSWGLVELKNELSMEQVEGGTASEFPTYEDARAFVNQSRGESRIDTKRIVVVQDTYYVVDQESLRNELVVELEAEKKELFDTLRHDFGLSVGITIVEPL